ncbi:MAG TPA: FliH/SctL family protein [Anaerovoracaceae bacterium]|nr:FliH/SctL family protein [Anaerovoracaceae bacterium]
MSSIVKAKQLVNMPPPVNKSVSDCGVVTNNGAAADSGRAAPAANDAAAEKADIDEAKQQKEAIIRQGLNKASHIENEARSRADTLIDNAMKSSRKMMEDAEKKGYEEGYLRGLVDGASASESAAEEGLLELRRLIDLFKTDQKAELERNEKDLIEIAFEIAKKIMKQHVQADESAVQKMLEEIVAENEGSYKIYFSEYQKTLDIHIDKATVKKMRNLTKDARLVLIKEEDLIMSENEGGIVDMSIPVQLEQLKKAVDRSY